MKIIIFSLCVLFSFRIQNVHFHRRFCRTYTRDTGLVVVDPIDIHPIIL
nr:MAG TPA: hypothetical protein [Caudoviricetes sp.]